VHRRTATLKEAFPGNGLNGESAAASAAAVAADVEDQPVLRQQACDAYELLDEGRVVRDVEGMDPDVTERS